MRTRDINTGDWIFSSYQEAYDYEHSIKCEICNCRKPENEVHVFTQRFGSEAVCNDCLSYYKREASDAGDCHVVEEIINYEKTL